MHFAPRSHISRSFLGLANYLKRFIPNYSTLTYPLRILTKKDSNFDRTENCEKAYYIYPEKHFDFMYSCIQHLDEKKPVILYCDASAVEISAVLLHQIDPKDANVTAYPSRYLTDTEQRYS